MRRNHRFAALALVLALIPTDAAAQGVQLRPIDRATVRVISLRGLDASPVRGERTGQHRLIAAASTSHGSGVVIGRRLVLTARHVVWGADAWAVVPPGSSTPVAARPVYVDEEHDLAFLAVDTPLGHPIVLPAPRDLTLNERISVSGYPLDLREPTPGAASGSVSRVTRTGALHLTISVNPGHSGGPVIDAAGRLIGILSMRGRPERGVEGLAIAVPLTAIVERRSRVPAEQPVFTAFDRDRVSAIAWITGLGESSLRDHADAILEMLERADEAGDAEHEAVLAGLAWNLVIEELEASSAPTVMDLPRSERARIGGLLREAGRLARRALRDGPQVRRRFPVLRAISLARPILRRTEP